MSSSRFPKKVMREVYDHKTVLDCVIEQLSSSKLIDSVVVATSQDKIDDTIERHLQKKGISCFRGNETDVLDRYYQCAREYSFPTIIRIPADKPIIDPFFVDKIIQEFLDHDFDYITTFNPPSFPRGSEVEIFNFSRFSQFSSTNIFEITIDQFFLNDIINAPYVITLIFFSSGLD